MIARLETQKFIYSPYCIVTGCRGAHVILYLSIYLEQAVRPHVAVCDHVAEQGLAQQRHRAQAEDVGGEAVEGEHPGEPAEGGQRRRGAVAAGGGGGGGGGGDQQLLPARHARRRGAVSEEVQLGPEQVGGGERGLRPHHDPPPLPLLGPAPALRPRHEAGLGPVPRHQPRVLHQQGPGQAGHQAPAQHQQRQPRHGSGERWK